MARNQLSGPISHHYLSCVQWFRVRVRCPCPVIMQAFRVWIPHPPFEPLVDRFAHLGTSRSDRAVSLVPVRRPAHGQPSPRSLLDVACALSQ